MVGVMKRILGNRTRFKNANNFFVTHIGIVSTTKECDDLQSVRIQKCGGQPPSTVRRARPGALALILSHCNRECRRRINRQISNVIHPVQ